MSTLIAGSAPFHLDHDGTRLELSAARDGLRTRVTLLRDGEPVAEATRIGAVLLPLDPAAGERGPTALALTPLPGLVSRALLLVPGPPVDPEASDGEPERPLDELVDELPKPLARFAGAAKREFAPPAGSPAARLAAFAHEHPRMWAARHVVLAAAKVALALLGVAAFIRLLVQPVISWVQGLVPDIDLPAIPWPDIDLPDLLPDIPWPDIDLPDLVLPPWLLVLVATAKFWAPILGAVGLAVVEVRRRRRAAAREGDEDRGAHG